MKLFQKNLSLKISVTRGGYGGAPTDANSICFPTGWDFYKFILYENIPDAPSTLKYL